MAEIPQPGGLASLAADYDAFIVDLWGVLHDGITAFPAAVDCLGRLKAAGKTVIILSNAPRRATVVAARNRELGIPDALVDLVMSSGEETWQHLKTKPDPWYRDLGMRCYHLGPARDLGMREGLDYDFVAGLDQADFILVTGILEADHGLEAYDGLLHAALARDVPMVCANPDLEVIRGGRRELCAGSIAQAYETIGGRLRSHGKPDPGIYRSCLRQAGLAADARVAMIGDSLRTDVAGAARAGLDAVFVVDGIHGTELGVDSAGDLDLDRLGELCAHYDAYPVALLPKLTW